MWGAESYGLTSECALIQKFAGLGYAATLKSLQGDRELHNAILD